MRTLVVGYGSIGMRHTEVLSNLGCTVSIVSKRKLNIERCYLNIKEAFDEEEPEYIIIATKTNEADTGKATIIAKIRPDVKEPSRSLFDD